MSMDKENIQLTDQNGVWRYQGQITLATAEQARMLADGMPLPESGVVDFSAVSHADSAALALLLVLLSRAAGESKTLTFQSVPEAMRVLARVYGLEPLLVL